jgi:hypothetical protein
VPPALTLPAVPPLAVVPPPPVTLAPPLPVAPVPVVPAPAPVPVVPAPAPAPGDAPAPNEPAAPPGLSRLPSTQDARPSAKPTPAVTEKVNRVSGVKAKVYMGYHLLTMEARRIRAENRAICREIRQLWQMFTEGGRGKGFLPAGPPPISKMEPLPEGKWLV